MGPFEELPDGLVDDVGMGDRAHVAESGFRCSGVRVQLPVPIQ